MSNSPRSPQHGRGTPGRHRGAPRPVRLPLHLPWRTLGVRSAVGIALLAGAVSATPGADRGAPTSLAAEATAEAAAGVTPRAEDSVDASSRLLDERISRAAADDRERPAVPRMRVTDTPAPTPLTIESIPPPAPTTAPTTVPATAATTAARPTASATAPAPARTPAPATTTTKAPVPQPSASPTAAAKAPVTAAPPAAGVSAAACADGSGVESGLTPDGIRVHRAVCALFPGVEWLRRTARHR